MRVGFFTETYLPHINGVSISLYNTKKELEEKRNKVYIFAPTLPGHIESQEDVIRLPSLKVFSAGHEQRMALPIPNETFRKMLTVKLVLVHAHGGGLFSFLGYQLALAKGYPFVLTYHAFIKHYTHYFLKGKLVNPKMIETGSRVFCNQADIVIVPSPKMKKELLRYGVTKPIEVVPNAIALESFGRVEKGYLRKKLSLSDKQVVLLTVSRLGKEKNIGFLLRAFAHIAKENSNSVLVIVGDGPEKEPLSRLASRLKLQDRVFFTGMIDKEDMPSVYADADIFLFASVSETQGMVVPEAAASGLPLVVVEDEAFTGAIEDGKNGFETRMNLKDFAEKTLSLINDKEKREEFGLYSKKLITKNFSNEKIVSELIKVYEKARSIRQKEPRLSNKVQGRFKDFVGLFRAVRELNKRLKF